MGIDVELRCPAGGFRNLLGKVRLTGDPIRIVDPNLIELACGSCARLARQQGRPVARVLHRFNILGDLVETEDIRTN